MSRVPSCSVVTGVVVTLCLLLAGCGSRIDGAEIAAQAGGSTVRLSEDSVAALKAATHRQAGPAGPRPWRPDRRDRRVRTSSRPIAGKPGEQAAATASAPERATTDRPGTTSGAVVDTGRCEKQLETINIGHVGLFSGIAGPLLGSAVTTMAAWAKDVNARGGLSCHPVRVFTKDDGGDAARSAALVKELAQREHVVAFVGSAIVAPAGFIKALEEVKIPAVGGGSGQKVWFNNPWIFPDGASPIETVVGFIKHGVERGKKKLGVLYCVEIGACTENMKLIRDGAAKEAGAELVYDSPVSVTQPDYTAQCINARNAGVDQLTLGVDGASMTRVVKSCATVNYRPLISTIAGLISPSQSKDPTLRSFGVVSASANAPWTERDTPGLREYHQAMSRWAPQLPADGASVLTWSGAKLFEAAMAKVDAQARRGAVTPALVLEGLGKIKDNTLGGLTGPVSFSPGQAHATSSGCVFYQMLTTEGWTAPRGSKPVCLKP